MIYMYSGTPGSGKSYHMAKDICMYYKKGRNIFLNFEVNTEYLKQLYPKSKAQVFVLDNRDLKYPFGLTGFSKNFHNKTSDGRVIENQSILFVDECNINYDSRNWNERGRSDWITWFKCHRKYGFKVILSTQDVKDVDRKIQQLIEIETDHFLVNNFKLFGKFLGLLCGGNLFIQREQWFSKSRHKAGKIGTSFCRGQKRYYRVFYTSEEFFTPETDRPVWRIKPL